MSYKDILNQYAFIQNKEEFWQKLINCKNSFFRINTLKASKEKILKALKNYSGLEFEEINLVENFYVLKKGNISKKPEHIFGYVYIQDLASGLVVDSFSKNKEATKDSVIIDLCACPGGKTTLLADLYRDCVIIANDLGSDRIGALVHNIQRIGALNCIVTQCDAKFFPYIRDKSILLILVDAPCSSESNLDNYYEYNINKHYKFVQYVTKLQYEILKRAIEISNLDTEIVYSTCTFNPLENEVIVDKFVKQGMIKIIPIENFSKWQNFFEDVKSGLVSYDSMEFDLSLKNSVRIYPGLTRGMFITKILPSFDLKEDLRINSYCVLRQLEENVYSQGFPLKKIDPSFIYEFLKFFTENEEFVNSLNWFYKDKGNKKIEDIYVSSIDKFVVKEKGPLKVEYFGLKAFKFYKPLNTYKPTSLFLTILNNYLSSNYVELKFDFKVLKRFLLREEILLDDLIDYKVSNNYPFVAVKFNGLVIGCGLVKGKNVFSQIPTSRANLILNSMM